VWAARSIDHRELMSEGEDLEMQRRARSDQEPKRMQQRDDDGRHASSLSKNPRNLNQRNAYGVSDRHKLVSFALAIFPSRRAIESSGRTGRQDVVKRHIVDIPCEPSDFLVAFLAKDIPADCTTPRDTHSTIS
jgi:hypothetical protein